MPPQKPYTPARSAGEFAIRTSQRYKPKIAKEYVLPTHKDSQNLAKPTGISHTEISCNKEYCVP